VSSSSRGAQRNAHPELRIGFTGHRRHRLKVPDRILMQRVLESIELLRHAGKVGSADQVEVVTALAEGSDEVAARAALKAGCRMIALLPFKPADYERTFSDRAYRPVFRDLLRKADKRIVLPGSLDDANAGYLAVGEDTLNRSDVVLTIWDGEPAQGRGGTPEILQSALERRLGIIWIDATQDRAPRLLQRKAVGPCPRIENVARRAPPATAANIPVHRRAWA
jgi:hypothetical protein